MIKICRPALPVFLLFFAWLGCRDNPTLPPAANGRFNFGVLRYDSAALEYRLDSLHNRGLVLQFLLTDPENNNSAFQLISYAYDTMDDHNNSWVPDTLRLVTDSLPRTFSGKITVGNNEVTREQLLNVVRDDNGNRFPYDYLLFSPVAERVFNHVVYMITPIKNGVRAPGSRMQMTSPMPPARVWWHRL